MNYPDAPKEPPPKDPDPLGRTRKAADEGKLRFAETDRIGKVMDHAMKFLARLAKRRGRTSTYRCTVSDRTTLSDFDEDQLNVGRNERTVVETGEEDRREEPSSQASITT